MAKRMPINLQMRQITSDLIAAGYEPEKSDIRAHMDSSLTFSENRINIGNIFGYRAGPAGFSASRHADLEMRAGDWMARDQRSRAAARQKGMPRKKVQKCGPKGQKRWQSDAWKKKLYPEKYKVDRKRDAKLPGCRVSASGNIYYERRVNRSDMPGRKT